MIEWLAAPIDWTRTHNVSAAVAWHGRLMVLAWCVLFPLGIIAARFFKITARQSWPAQLDNKAWWIAHNGLQYAGAIALATAIFLVTTPVGWSASVHAILGWLVVMLTAIQFFGGWFRGTKGGPTEPQPDGSLHGDHYAMTKRRRLFERTHKSVGYIAVSTALCAMPTGLWLANAPRWMWISIGVWWTALIAFAIVLQRRGRAVDTYQAIWGPDPKHPGNKIKPIGWRIHRPPEKKQS
jgi:hypothetical protein